MAVTTTLRQRGKMGNMRLNVVDAAIAAETYATGGISISAAKLGLGLAYVVLPSPAGGYIFEYDHANSKLKAFTPVKEQAVHTHVNTLGNAAHTHANTATTVLSSGHTITATPTVTPTSGTTLLSYSGADIKGSANTDSENADAGAAPTNAGVISPATAVAIGVWAHGGITDPDRGRNIGIVITNDSGGPLNLFEGAMTFAVTGFYRGVAQNENIIFTSTAGNKALATANFRFKYGVKPFDQITDITLDNVPDDGLKLGACPGSKIALPSNLTTPAEADVKKITKNVADLATTGIVDTTNMTVNLGALADGDDFTIVYSGITVLTGVGVSNAIAGDVTTTGTVTMANAAETVTITNATGGAISASAAAEVGNGVSVTATPRLIAIGI